MVTFGAPNIGVDLGGILGIGRKKKEEEERRRLTEDLVKQRLGQGYTPIIPEQKKEKLKFTTKGITGTETVIQPQREANPQEIVNYIMSGGQDQQLGFETTKGIGKVTNDNLELIDFVYPNKYKVGDSISMYDLNKAVDTWNKERISKEKVTSQPGVVSFNPTENKFYKGNIEVSPESLTGKEKVVTIQQSPIIKEAGLRAGKLSEMYKLIDFFETKINEIPSGEGLMGRAKGLGLKVSGALQLNPKVTAYEASLSGLRSQIARGLGEVGNLAEQEQKFAMDLLPRITDNTETRQAKLKNFKDYIDLKIGKTNISGQSQNQFNSIEEAESANIPSGTIVYIKGKKARID